MREDIESRKNARLCISACDIYEENGSIVCRIEMPGAAKENIDVRIEDDHLLISGRKEINRPDGNFRIREIREGDYLQKFTLDDTIDKSRVDANIRNGILTIKLNIKESEKPKKIKITSG